VPVGPGQPGRRIGADALAAAGHSNREIAEQLYITMRTAETHLTHAFQKLEITSRTELAGQMAAVPLVDQREPAS
jgi:FixJ family two-component response regulator